MVQGLTARTKPGRRPEPRPLQEVFGGGGVDLPDRN